MRTCNLRTQEADMGGFPALFQSISYVLDSYQSEGKLNPTCDLQAGSLLRPYKLLEAHLDEKV